MRAWLFIAMLVAGGCPKPPLMPEPAMTNLGDLPPAPSGDRDGDGILDDADKCPDDPEDIDAFEDGDGCPDPDNDSDGIVDAADKCPNDPEDKDWFEDDDGCPDPDNDSDGIVDAQDQCPDKAETMNGLVDDDGCPDGVIASLRLPERASSPVKLKPDPTPTPTPTPIAPVPQGRAMASATQANWVIAVMTVENSGAAALKESLRRGLTDQMRVFLGARRMKVIDRGAMEEAFRELMTAEKAKSYASCVDASCQIPLGKAVAATHILRTTVGRFGNSCTLNAELVDLAKEIGAAAVSNRCGCKDNELLDAAEKLVDELIRESH